MPCLDANVWIYYFDETLPEHERVRNAIRPPLESASLFTTTVLQMEVIHYLERQLETDANAIDRFLSLSDTVVAELSTDDIYRATDYMDRLSGTGVGGRDATVLAAMERYDVSELWTHDTGLKRAGERIEWLSVTDPVAET